MTSSDLIEEKLKPVSTVASFRESKAYVIGVCILPCGVVLEKWLLADTDKSEKSKDYTELWYW